MSTAFRDFIPAGENTDGLVAGFTDFVPPKVPIKSKEDEIAAKRLENLAKARAAKAQK